MNTPTTSGQTSTPSPTWVIGSDGSACAEHAAKWAAVQSRGRAGRLRLASYWTLPIAPAVPPVGPVSKYWDVESFASATRDGVHALADTLRPLAGDGTTIDTVIAEGQASSHLLAESRKADLLVVGSRGRGGFARLILGSTSTQCATHAHVPTAIIRAEAPLEPVERIVVAFDGSATSVDALRWALHFAPDGASVSVVQVWEPMTIPMGADQMVFIDAMDATRDCFAERTAEVIAEVDVDARDLDVTCEFVEGRTHAELAARAADSDLLVAGARGTGAIGAALLGSVSSWLLHHVATPTVIVPNAESAEAS